jgi:hypothetical protein
MKLKRRGYEYRYRGNPTLTISRGELRGCHEGVQRLVWIVHELPKSGDPEAITGLQA